MPEYTLASILPFVRVGLRRRVGPRFGFTEFVSAVWTALENLDTRIQRERPYNPGNVGNVEFRHANDPDDLKRAAVEAWLYLQRRGFAIPSAMTFPFNPADASQLELTTRGREWVDGREPIPELAAEYLAALGAVVPTLDATVKEYVEEGLGSFEHDRFRAAAVMIGAASEKALYMLADAMLGAISTPQSKDKFATPLRRRDLADLFDRMKRLLEKADAMTGRPFEIFDGGQDHLVSLIKAVQVQRNNAVHPMNEKVTDETVRLSYLAFPFALQKMEQLREWFSNNPNAV